MIFEGLISAIYQEGRIKSLFFFIYRHLNPQKCRKNIQMGVNQSYLF
ncbi:MAG: dsRNA-specific ribonuclease [Salibacteraceae bacterium]|jgi:dsRNA-specific ribonuclease